MRQISLLLCFFLIPLSMGCNPDQEQTTEQVLYIRNDHLKAGLLTGVGGRLVFFGKIEGNNLLRSDSALWYEPESERPKPSPDAKFKAYNGHINWLGPQSEWWSHQDLNQDRKERKAIWPPDPYLVYASYKVIEHTRSSILLEGPHSPVSGVSLIKRYTLSDNTLEIEVWMKNTSDEPVAWDIWSNTRFEENTDFFIPRCEEGILRVATEESEKIGRLDSKIVGGAFTFNPVPPGHGQDSRYAKAFLHPELGQIVIVRDETMMVMDFEHVSPENLHPDQGLVEIYQLITKSGDDDLLELEHHSAYTRLIPGETFRFTETWSVYDYSGTRDISEYLNFLEDIGEQQ